MYTVMSKLNEIDLYKTTPTLGHAHITQNINRHPHYAKYTLGMCMYVCTVEPQ